MTTSSAREPLGSQPEVAEYLGIPERTLEHWRQADVGPRYFSVRRHVRYRWSDVDAWLASQPQGGGVRQDAPARDMTTSVRMTA